ncbi:uncharacterized protein EAF02_010445 [Botrytis sinoallii]|uniref:uncharacterized protein n=1 Tax=Botrytis sinoallii TaxID=1463999 RepID=UPI0019001509|nr:uncharacterized protein EAF02_010445 [Botrytis sinoallii]KAF7862896.1 hypothetical protein EAF02_010445 [Botrytis sinoallii]
MAITTPFQTQFAVPMTCEACIKDIEGSLFKLGGIQKVEANLKDQLVTIEGTTAPSEIVKAIEETGRDAILRGSGGSDVRGLVRMVQVSPTLTLVDLTIRGLQEGTYWATVREAGDISNGAISTAGLWKGGNEDTPRGTFGTVSVGKNGMGISKQHEGDRKFEKNDENTLVGVIARSAGVWDNDKTVCSCSGKTLWEERKDEVSKGML